MAVALLALFIALGGSAVAVQSSGDRDSRAATTAAAVRDAATANAQPAAKQKQRKRRRGPRGAPGLQGPPGLQGAQGLQGVQGPVGPTFADVEGAQDPPAPEATILTNTVNTPAAGRLLVMLEIQSLVINCDLPGGNVGAVGLYVDGVAVPGSLRVIAAGTTGTPEPPVPVQSLGATAASLPAGAHTVTAGVGCLDVPVLDSFALDSDFGHSLGAVLLG